ncbi:MAG: hypothetical protein Q7T19_08750 [Caulobacter sp.]|nr:hypothetical protein [Caulobacter sp.]
MSLTRRGMILSAAALAVAPGVSLAADKKKPPPPAKKVFPYYDLYLSIPAAERTRFVMNYYLRLNGKPASGQGLYLVRPGGARTLLAQAPDGRITRMPTLAELRDGVIEADEHRESDRFSLAMELEPIVRLGETMPTADLAAALDQSNAAIRKKAGLIGFAVPKMEQVIFVGAGSGQALLTGGKTAPLPAFKAMPFYRPADLAGAQTLKFARAPTRALLAGKTK